MASTITTNSIWVHKTEGYKVTAISRGQFVFVDKNCKCLKGSLSSECRRLTRDKFFDLFTQQVTN